MFIKYNKHEQEQNERYEHRVVLQSIEDTINMLRRFKEENNLAGRPERKLEHLMKEKSKLRSQLYEL